ncbi:MAG TPA: hypothetical protein VGP25_17620 [Gemmatimonadaceae bacterium]|nr:hypothetical protein [Gemmatimonadaceae bacterium]
MSDFIEIAKVLTLLCIPILVIGAAVPLGRALAARLSPAPPLRDDSRVDLAALEARLANRLAGLEQAVDAVSIEVERVGEAQRYVARLLPNATSNAVSRVDGRVQSTTHDPR